MDNIRDLYQEVIIEHGRHPRHFGTIVDASSSAKGKNALCGDQITVYLNIIDNTITDIKFDGQGCAICMASSSLMAEHLFGKSVEAASALFETFHRLITEQGFELCDDSLGKLVILSGVREYPARVKCATLAWHTLMNAIQYVNEIATTE
jgi:nitrogen fixation NifU-like protein